MPQPGRKCQRANRDGRELLRWQPTFDVDLSSVTEEQRQVLARHLTDNDWIAMAHLVSSIERMRENVTSYEPLTGLPPDVHGLVVDQLAIAKRVLRMLGTPRPPGPTRSTTKVS